MKRNNRPIQDLQKLQRTIFDKKEAASYYHALKSAEMALIESGQGDITNTVCCLEELRTFFFLLHAGQ